jgi:hypothetical protein
VLLLAFLLASVPARNSDLWMHLATGRALVHGEYHFGEDPFAQTTAGVYWVNHAWLSDLAAFGLYTLIGGAGLVVLKALLAVALAAVLVFQGRAGRGLWAASACAALAVLAISPGLLLQPMALSFLFLALTLWFLERARLPLTPTPLPRGERGRGEGQPAVISFTAYWPLLVLFALWVNLDAWFFLGPLVVALYAVGQALQAFVGPDRDDPRAVRRGEAGVLGLVLLAGLAACLLNPHHVYAFLAPPSQLAVSPAALELRQERLFQGLALSPFSADYFHPAQGGNVAGCSYFLLVLLSAGSFVLNREGWRWRRALVWLALFGLSAVQARAVPFFAVAAGPILALNAQEYFARRRAASRWAASAAARWAVAGRVVSLLGGLLVVAAAWPGWLQAFPFEPRGWAAEPDPALVRAAAQLRQWRQDGVIGPDDHAFPTSADAANQLAWLCPEEKGFLDTRLTPFPRAAAADYLAVWRGLVVGRDAEAAGGDWREVLRRNKVTHVIVNDSDPARGAAWAARLTADPDEWTLVSLEGGTTVYAWRDRDWLGWAGPAEKDRLAAYAPDWDRLALRPAADRKAPAEGPGRDPEPPGWADPFVKPRAARGQDREEAELLVRLFEEVLGPRQVVEADSAWYFSLAASAAAPPAGTPADAALADLRVRGRLLEAAGQDAAPGSIEADGQTARVRFRRARDDGPPAVLLLAIRAARRAVRANPDDALAWQALGRAYLHLDLNTRDDRLWADRTSPERPPPLLPLIRRGQAAAALHQALLLNPNLERAHAALFELYAFLGDTDLAVQQEREMLRCALAAGPRPGETAEQRLDRLKKMQDTLGEHEKKLDKDLSIFEVNTTNLPVRLRAEEAEKRGLPGRALALLAESDYSAFGRKGAEMELDLLLLTGRLQEFRQNLEVAGKYLNPVTRDRLRLRLAAAQGDYARADELLEDLTAPLRSVYWGRPPDEKGEYGGVELSTRAAAPLAVAEAVRGGWPQGEPFPGGPATTMVRYNEFLTRLLMLTSDLKEEADYNVLRGLLALEAGEVDQARDLFREALSLSGSDEAVRAGTGLEFSGRVVAQEWLEKLDKQKP